MSIWTVHRPWLPFVLTIGLLGAASVACQPAQRSPSPASGPPTPTSIAPTVTRAPALTATAGAIVPVATESPARPRRTVEGAASTATFPATSAAVLVPASPETVVVQVGHIRHSPWEPVLLAQMAPEFSLQASGFVIFAADGGPSADGWYQSMLPPQSVERFLHVLVEEVGIHRLAARYTGKEVRFRSNAAGEALGERELVVVYVNCNRGAARLVLDAEQLREPLADEEPQLARLASLLAALNDWRTAAVTPLPATRVESATAALGWWMASALPYTPDTIVLSGTLAAPFTPPQAPTLDWPLEEPLANLVAVPFGSEPAEVSLSGEKAVLVWRRSREAPPSFWGPLWRDASGGQRYLVAARIAPPESNHLRLAYDYAPPPNLAEPSNQATATPTR